MGNATYRKLNDGSHSSSTYHKKDGTSVRQILKRETEKLVIEAHDINQRSECTAMDSDDTYSATVRYKDSIVFQETGFASVQLALHAIDAFIKSQGWETFTAYHARRPLRYKMWQENGIRWQHQCDQVCTDRLTGKEVFRYDLGDPANTDPEYGGVSNHERFKRLGLDQHEHINILDCMID